MNIINLQTAIYLCLTALAVILEHLTFGKWWEDNELARRTMGIMTIMALAVPFVALGVMDGITWLMILFAFGTAGAVKTGLVVYENERIKARNAAEAAVLRERADAALDE